MSEPRARGILSPVGSPQTTASGPTANDVAAYIAERVGSEDAMKVLKLLYFAQAWALVWDEAPLFSDPIEAWTEGPVVYRVWRSLHDGEPLGDPGHLSDADRATVDAVIDCYGTMSGFKLSALTHREPAWQEARDGLESWQPSSEEIPPARIARHYAGLRAAAPRKEIPASVRRGIRLLLEMTPAEAADLRRENEDLAHGDALNAWLCSEHDRAPWDR